MSGSNKVQVFDLPKGYVLPEILTFKGPPNPTNNVGTVTFGGVNGVTPVSMDNFVKLPCDFGHWQEYQARATTDNSFITFEITSPSKGLPDTNPNGMVLVVANVHYKAH